MIWRVIFITGLIFSGEFMCYPNSITESKHEYHDVMTNVLQTVWGDKVLSPGGIKKLDVLCKDIDLSGKKVLDFGCGLGGYALYLAENYNAIVTGVDIDPMLIKEAQKNGLMSKKSSQAMKASSLGDTLRQKMGQEILDYCLESWQLQTVVLQQSELQTLHIFCKKS